MILLCDFRYCKSGLQKRPSNLCPMPTWFTCSLKFPTSALLRHPERTPSVYQTISCGLSPFRKLNEEARYERSIGSVLIVARRALSIAFWSAARLLDGFFFYSIISPYLPGKSNQRRFIFLFLTSGFSPWLKKASSPFFLSLFSRAKYFSPATSSTFAESIPVRSIFWEVAIT
jgi:hypothetical protein